MEEKYLTLLSYFDKQIFVLEKLIKVILDINLDYYDKRYVFATKTQQFYTALEDLFKQIARTFENNIEKIEKFHSEMLKQMNLDILRIRPAVISNSSLPLLNDLRSFRHFFRHAYDCELNEMRLKNIKNEFAKDHTIVMGDLQNFRKFIVTLSMPKES